MVDPDTACNACGSAEDGEAMLLCDACDTGFHMFCLKPKVTRVPNGDWFCPRCIGKNKPLAAAASSGSSRFLGVRWHRSQGKWAVQLRKEGRQQHIGYFDEDDEEGAARAFDAAARRFRGAQAHGGPFQWRLNFPTAAEQAHADSVVAAANTAHAGDVLRPTALTTTALGGDAAGPGKSSAERTGSDVAHRGPRPAETPNPYRKACPSCNRVFTHAPAYTVHVKAALCGLSKPPPPPQPSPPPPPPPPQRRARLPPLPRLSLLKQLQMERAHDTNHDVSRASGVRSIKVRKSYAKRWKVYHSLTQAAEVTEVDRSDISKCARGHWPHLKGWIFEYLAVDEDEDDGPLLVPQKLQATMKEARKRSFLPTFDLK